MTIEDPLALVCLMTGYALGLVMGGFSGVTYARAKGVRLPPRAPRKAKPAKPDLVSEGVEA